MKVLIILGVVFSVVLGEFMTSLTLNACSRPVGGKAAIMCAVANIDFFGYIIMFVFWLVMSAAIFYTLQDFIREKFRAFKEKRKKLN
ncbi:MAG: hypothetical protein LBC64_08595 [Fibromonadaceae bacterium]|jgi:formate hydrogenlyase subunit 3/multisubunit Na+/H+ antiporter MnhD subunit|nr:hypothetical protein [Fibromonadaceae bacterium]